MKLFLSIAVLLAISFASCKDEAYEEVCVCGKGGNLTFIFKPQHHGDPIASTSTYRDTIYMKYGAQAFPGADRSNYDAYFVGVPGENEVKVENMRCGIYYFYGAGYDASISEVVRGGIPFITESTSGTIEIPVPVTED